MVRFALEIERPPVTLRDPLRLFSCHGIAPELGIETESRNFRPYALSILSWKVTRIVYIR